MQVIIMDHFQIWIATHDKQRITIIFIIDHIHHIRNVRRNRRIHHKKLITFLSKHIITNMHERFDKQIILNNIITAGTVII